MRPLLIALAALLLAGCGSTPQAPRCDGSARRPINPPVHASHTWIDYPSCGGAAQGVA